MDAVLAVLARRGGAHPGFLVDEIGQRALAGRGPHGLLDRAGELVGHLAPGLAREPRDGRAAHGPDDLLDADAARIARGHEPLALSVREQARVDERLGDERQRVLRHADRGREALGAPAVRR